MTINSERIKSLAMVLDSYAQTTKQKECVQNFLNTRETNENEIILELVSAIHAGLRYGNWPWVIAKLNSHIK